MDDPLLELKQETLINLIRQYPNGLLYDQYLDRLGENIPTGWDYQSMSENQSLPFWFVVQNPDLPWNWTKLVKNPSLTVSDIILFRDKWRWEEWVIISQLPIINIELVRTCINNINGHYISSNPALTLEMIIELVNHNVRLCYERLSVNPAIVREIIEPHLNGRLSSECSVIMGDYFPIRIKINDICILLKWDKLSSNTGLTDNIIEAYGGDDARISKDDFDRGRWYWTDMSSNPCLSEYILLRFLDRWDYEQLQLNTNLSPSFITDYIFEDWIDKLLEGGYISEDMANVRRIKSYWMNSKWYWLSSNSAMTPELIMMLEYELDMYSMILNRSLTSELLDYLIEKYGLKCRANKLKCKYGRLSPNPDITLENRSRFDLTMFWNRASKHPSLTPEIVIKYAKHNLWNWEKLSKHPMVTPELILMFHDKWSMRFLTINPSVNYDFIILTSDPQTSKILNQPILRWSHSGLSQRSYLPSMKGRMIKSSAKSK